MNYEQAKARAQALWEAHEDAAAILNVFPRGAMGLVTDEAKASPEWKVAYAAERKAFNELRTFNAWYVKTFKTERLVERKSKLTNYQK